MTGAVPANLPMPFFNNGQAVSRPPPSEQAGAVVAELCKPRPTKVIPFPRRGMDQKVRIQVLSVEDLHEARIAAWRVISEERRVPTEWDRTSAIEAVYRDEAALQTLLIAIVTVDPINDDPSRPIYGRVFMNSNQFRQHLTADELTSLYNSYLMVQAELGPFQYNLMTTANVNAWILRLVEGLDENPLGEMPYPALAELCTALAARCYLLSMILAPRYWTSPDTLGSNPDACFSGTSSSTEPPSGQPGMSSSTGSSTALPEGRSAEEAIALGAALIAAGAPEAAERVDEASPGDGKDTTG